VEFRGCVKDAIPGDILNVDHRLNGEQSGKGARFLGTQARERSDDAQAAFLTFGRFVDTRHY
jgi:hypothetical protein